MPDFDVITEEIDSVRFLVKIQEEAYGYQNYVTLHVRQGEGCHLDSVFHSPFNIVRDR